MYFDIFSWSLQISAFCRGYKNNRTIHAMICIRINNILLMNVVTWYCNTLSESCKTTYTRPPMQGQRCHVDNPENLTTLWDINRLECVASCQSTESCVVLSHNYRLNYCELSPQYCDKVEPNPDFTLNVYGIERSRCVNWAPPAQYDSQTAVEFLRTPGHWVYLTVGRAKDSTGLFPGKYQNNTWKVVYAANASAFVKGSNCEVLLVDPDCMWAWIAYTPGTVLPVGAIEAGYYGNDLLYVARSMFFDGSQYGIGYYWPSLQVGYFAHYADVFNKTDLEILVIM